VLVATVTASVDAENDTEHAGAVVQATPKFMTHDVSVPPPVVILPKLSDPATAGEPTPQAEIAGEVEAARICDPALILPPT
jgi:hypothetical protein